MPSEDRLKKVTAGIETDPWGPAVFLDAVNAEPFPVDDLPTWVQDFVTGLAHATQTPPDLAGSLSLAVIAACAGGKVELEVKENWPETLNDYYVVVLGSGEGKTPVFTKVVEPLVMYERELVTAMQPEIVNARTRQQVAEKRRDKAILDASKARTDIADAEDYAQRTAEAAAAIIVPDEPRFIIQDISPEKLGEMLAKQNGRLALLSAEGGVFGAMAGRYEANKKGGPSAGLDVWLGAHNGEAIRVDRIGRPSDFVEHAYLTIGIAAQPAVIRGLMADAEMRGRGVLARFNYSIPTSMVGYQNARALPFTQEMQEAWNSRVLTMARSFACGGRVILSVDAEEILTQYYETIVPRMRQSGDLYPVADWVSKHRGRVARIAARLHLADHFDKSSGWEGWVDVGTMQRAIRLGDYYLNHALIAFDLMGGDETRDRMRYILRLFADRPEKFAQPFTRGHVMEAGNRSSLPDAPTTQVALNGLVDFNWIRSTGRTPKHGTDLYELRPDFMETVKRSISRLSIKPPPTPPHAPRHQPSAVPQPESEPDPDSEPVNPDLSSQDSEPEGMQHIAAHTASEDSEPEPSVTAEEWDELRATIGALANDDYRLGLLAPLIVAVKERAGHADAAQDFTADELTELWRIVLLPDSGPVVVPPEPVAAEPGPEALLTDAFPGAEVAGPSIEERFAVIARKLKTTTPSSPVGAAAKVITAKVRERHNAPLPKPLTWRYFTEDEIAELEVILKDVAA
jgi:hypothetical protein